MRHVQNGADSCSCGEIWPCRRRTMTSDNFPLIHWLGEMPTIYQVVCSTPTKNPEIQVQVIVYMSGSVVWQVNKKFPLDSPIELVMEAVTLYQSEAREFIRLAVHKCG